MYKRLEPSAESQLSYSGHFQSHLDVCWWFVCNLLFLYRYIQLGGHGGYLLLPKDNGGFLHGHFLVLDRMIDPSRAPLSPILHAPPD